MFYGLAHREEKFFADALHKFIALAPCTISPEQGQESYWEQVLYSLPEIDVHALYGSRQSLHLEHICSKLGEKACKYAASCESC